MTAPFGHETLIVYQKGLRFAGVRRALLDRLKRRVAACDHLDRGAESILVNKSTTSVVLNIAEGSGRFTGTNQATFYDIAYKAVVQSASLLDLTSSDNVEQGREWLRRIATMLSTLSKVKSHG